MNARALAAVVLALGSMLGACASQGAAPAHAPAAQPSAAQAALYVPASLSDKLRRISGELIKLGLRPDPKAFAGFLPSGNHATYALRVPSDSCMTLVALATPNVQDVDAALYTADGDLLAIDSEPDPHPTIQICAKAATALYYVLQLYDGDGSFLMQPFYGSRSTLAAAARVLGGRPAVTEALGTRELAEDPQFSLAEGLRKRGFTQLGAAESIDIAEHERVRTSLSAQAGECYTLAAFGSPGLRELGMHVLDERGKTLAADDDDKRPQAAVQLCAHESASYSVELEASVGSGSVTLMIFRTDVATAGGEESLWLGRRSAR